MGPKRMIITECPRDAMQGLPYLIPLSEKIQYLESLMAAGFQQLDCGSFVSPKAVPQMRDTPIVLEAVLPYKGNCIFSVVVGNKRGAEAALSHPAVDVIGYPWSISPSFLKYNLRSNPSESNETLLDLQQMVMESGKELAVYISMAFGNPYGDHWSRELLIEAVDFLVDNHIQHIILSDTVGLGTKTDISFIFNWLKDISSTIIGAHFHSHQKAAKDKIQAAWDAGCRRFDSALNGLGGCPFSGQEMLGNINTMDLIIYCQDQGIQHGLDIERLLEAQALASRILMR